MRRLVIAPTPALRQPQLPAKVSGEVSNSNTAEANGTLYGGEDDEVIRFVILAPGDDPMQGCAECPACIAINTPKGRSSGSHTCWARGLMGGAKVKEKDRRDAMRDAALAALAEQGGP